MASTAAYSKELRKIAMRQQKAQQVKTMTRVACE